MAGKWLLLGCITEIMLIKQCKISFFRNLAQKRFQVINEKNNFLALLSFFFFFL